MQSTPDRKVIPFVRRWPPHGRSIPNAVPYRLKMDGWWLAEASPQPRPRPTGHNVYLFLQRKQTPK